MNRAKHAPPKKYYPPFLAGFQPPCILAPIQELLLIEALDMAFIFHAVENIKGMVYPVDKLLPYKALRNGGIGLADSIILKLVALEKALNAIILITRFHVHHGFNLLRRISIWKGSGRGFMLVWQPTSDFNAAPISSAVRLSSTFENIITYLYQYFKPTK